MSDIEQFIKKDQKGMYPSFVYAIVDGVINGQTYIDRWNEGILLGTEGGVYAAGGRPQDLTSTLRQLFRERRANQLRFTLFSASDACDEWIEQALGNNVRRMRRYAFSFDNHQVQRIHHKPLPASFSLHSINEGIIDRSHQFTPDYYKEYWGSVEAFLQNGIGVAVLDGETVVSECVSIFCSSSYAEIDVETLPSYQGLGLASHAVSKFIQLCVLRHLTPSWDCDKTNLRSVTLAGKCGFTVTKEYSIYVPSYNSRR